MNDPVLIERSDLFYLARQAAREAIQEMEKDHTKRNPLISQNQAAKKLGKGGRGKLERAMAKGLVRFHKRDPEKRLGRVMVYAEDIEKIRDNPKI
jgi:hypothetical protein